MLVSLSRVAINADLMYWDGAVHDANGVVLATQHDTWFCVPRRQGSQCHQLQSI